MMFARTIAVAAVTVAGFAAEASAQPPRKVAVVDIEIAGDAAPELRGQMDASIVRGLQASGVKGVSAEAVRNAIDDDTLIGCTSTTCLRRIGELVGAHTFVAATVEASGASYSFGLRLMSPTAEGGVLRSLERSCAVCTITELSDQVADATSELLDASRDPAVEVEIVTRPGGAALRIGPDEVGAAPWTGNLEPGLHTVHATHEGYVDATQTIEVTSSADQRFEVVLTPRGIDTPEPTADRPFKKWKWITGSGAIAGLGVGIGLLSVHGNGTCTLMDPQRQCPEELDTVAGGALAVTAGVALGAVSAWMFIRDARDADSGERRTDAAVVPTRGGGFATVRIRF